MEALEVPLDMEDHNLDMVDNSLLMVDNNQDMERSLLMVDNNLPMEVKEDMANLVSLTLAMDLDS